jgi:8-oxo-dGTP diphosphatase
LRHVSELDGWRVCPRCGSELERDDGRVHCDACGFVFYASSRPTASAVVVGDDGRLLLSRRAFEPFAGKWDLPGGFLEEGEHPLDCLRRELREEAGIEIAVERFLGVVVDRYGDDPSAVATLNLYWSVRVVAGTLKPSDDVSELRWFAPDDVPIDELAFEHIEQVISTWRNEHA